MRLDTRTLTRAIGIAIPLVLGLGIGRALAPWIPQFAATVERMGVWAPIVFTLAYATGVVLLFPVFLLIMVGGAVFGTVQGTLLAMTGALGGGTLAFLIGRHVARAQVERRIAGHPVLSSLDRVVGEDGLKLVFLLRLSPTVPYVLSNYALSVTRVRFRDFVLGTFGLVPIVATYAAYGSASGTAGRGGAPVPNSVLAIGMLATAVLGLLLARLVQRAIRDAEHARALTSTETIA